MDDTWSVSMLGRSLLLHKPRCPQFLHSGPLAMHSFLHAKSKIHATFFFSSTSSNPVPIFFIFSINSSLSPFHALHLIRKCFTSSTSPLSHYVHFLSSLFKPLISPPPPATLLYPPLAVSILQIFFLLTHTNLASNPPLTSSFNTHSFGCSTNSSAHIVVTSLHTQFFITYFTSAFDTPFKLSNLTSPHPKSALLQILLPLHFSFQ